MARKRRPEEPDMFSFLGDGEREGRSYLCCACCDLVRPHDDYDNVDTCEKTDEGDVVFCERCGAPSDHFHDIDTTDVPE